MKKLLLLLAGVLSLSCLSACSSSQVQKAAVKETTIAETTKAPEESKSNAAETTIAPSNSEAAELTNSNELLKIGSLKGPTSMGLVHMMDLSSKGEAMGNYEFTMVTAADELLGKIVNGDLDIALLPANMASIIYNKTNADVSLIDINTLGVLYTVSSDESIKSIADLKGKTVYLTGKGTSPEYVINYLLTQNGLTADDVSLEYKSEAAEVASVLKEKEGAIGILPQPFVTVAMAQNEKLKMVVDLTKEWENTKEANGGSLVTGVTICRNEVLKNSPEAVKNFMEDHKKSAEFTNSNPDETAELIAANGIIEKAPVAKKALPYCSITYIDGSEMKEKVSGYLDVLFKQNPASVGGKLPDESFYYVK